MKTRTEWIVAALLMGACGGSERIDGRAQSIEPEKALIASAKRAESEAAELEAAEPETAKPEPPGAGAPPEIELHVPRRPMLRGRPNWAPPGAADEDRS